MPVSESIEGETGRETGNTNTRKRPPEQRDPDNYQRVNSSKIFTMEEFQEYGKKREAEFKILKAKLAEKEAKLAEKEAKLAEKEAECKILAEKEAKLAEKEAECKILEAERVEQEKVDYEASVARLIADGVPELRGSGEPFEHENEGANIKVNEGFISSEHLEFDVEAKYQDAGRDHLQGKWIRSDLASEIKRQMEDGEEKRFVKYTNETTVQALIYRLLKDVINVIGCEDVLEIFLELTIFGLRPDLVLVIHPKLGVILIIEVKNPSADKCKVFSSEQIAKQIHDYLKVMERTGHTTPFVLVMAYEELVFARLDQENEKYSQVVRNSAALLKKSDGKIALEEKKGATKPAASPPGKSPRENSNSDNPTIPPVIHAGDQPNDEDEDEALEEGDDYKPDVVYSRIFGRQNIMKALILAVACGIESLNNMKPTNEGTGTLGGVANLPAEGQVMEKDMPFVRESTFRWKKCKEKITHKQFPGTNSKGFFLVDTLGVGNKGKVFLASNTSGRTLAIKFYPHDYKYLEAHNPNDRQRKKEQTLQDTKKSAEKEAERWRLLYPQYKAMVGVSKLNAMWVVKMPYFAPIPKERRLDPAILQDVARILSGFATKKLRTKEVRWGHIGCRRNERGQLELTLLDLESLRSSDANDIPGYLRNHLRGLVEHSGLVGSDNIDALFDDLLEKIDLHCL